MLGWFNAAAAKEFGAGLAQFYIERIPVTLAITEKKFATCSAILSSTSLDLAANFFSVIANVTGIRSI